MEVTIICDAYCFQLREFSNDNSFGTKINFEFSRENSQCSINDLEHLSAISLFVCPAQIPTHFLDDKLPSSNLPRRFFSDVTLQCKLYEKTRVRLYNRFIQDSPDSRISLLRKINEVR